MKATAQCSGSAPWEKAHSTLHRIVSRVPPGMPNAAGTKGTPANVSQNATEYREEICSARCAASANPAESTEARAASPSSSSESESSPNRLSIGSLSRYVRSAATPRSPRGDANVARLGARGYGHFFSPGTDITSASAHVGNAAPSSAARAATRVAHSVKSFASTALRMPQVRSTSSHSRDRNAFPGKCAGVSLNVNANSSTSGSYKSRGDLKSSSSSTSTKRAIESASTKASLSLSRGQCFRTYAKTAARPCVLRRAIVGTTWRARVAASSRTSTPRARYSGSAAATYARVSGERYEASANGTSGGHVVKCVCVERKDTQIFSRVVS